jgi:uncharacterized protein YdeI (YjbR/CyaY-like superfamily)
MPDYVEAALRQHALMRAYQERPPYQQNDYIGWIIRPRKPETRAKRLEQMLKELAGGGLYMNMPYRPAAREAGEGESP